MKMQTTLIVILAAVGLIFGGLATTATAWTADDPSNDNPAPTADADTVGSVAMPLSETDQLPDFEQPSHSRALTNGGLPDGQGFNDTGYEFVLVMLGRSPDSTTMANSLAQANVSTDFTPTGRPMEPSRRPDAEDMQPVQGATGTQAVWMDAMTSDGSVAPNQPFGNYDTPSQSVDPMVLIGADGNVQIQSDDPYTSKNLLLMGGNLRAKNLTLGALPAKLELDAVRFNVTDAVTIDPKCEVITHVRTTPAGLDLEEDVPLTIAGTGRLRLLFHSAPNVEGIHWGLRAVGDRQAEFKQLVESGKIVVGLVYNGTVTNSPAVVIFDGHYTYVTIDLPKFDRPVYSQTVETRVEVPEPMTMGLLAIGGVALLKRRK